MKRKIENEPQKNFNEIGIISDLHVGSNFFDLDEFEKYLSQITLKGITVIYCTGDLLEFNDLFSNRIEKESYIKNYIRFVNLLERYNITIINLQGNHEEELLTQDFDFYSNIKKLSKRIVFIENNTTQLSILGKKIKIGHFLDKMVAKADFTVGGHTHYTQRKNKYLNAGTFRRHHKDKVTVGGFILGITYQNISLTPIGENNDHDTYLKAIASEGFYPNIVDLEKEREKNNQDIIFFTRLLHKLRDIDPNCIFWITGSLAAKCADSSLGSVTNRYKLSKENDDFLIDQDDTNVDLFMPISDIDIEIISEVIKPDQTKKIISELHLEGYVPTPLRKIEICCYRNQDIINSLRVLSDKHCIHSDASNQHNYFIYRFLLAPKGIIDDRSKQMLTLYISQAVEKMKYEFPNLANLQDNATIKTAKAYYHGFKKIKHDLKKGKLKRTVVKSNEPLAAYLRIKTDQKADNLPPYSTSNQNPNTLQSFKITFPQIDLLLQEKPTKEYNIIIPPISAYDDEIHIGQLIGVFVGQVLSRIYSTESQISFQTTGPYWEKNRNHDIEKKINTNIIEILKRFECFGIYNRFIYREDSKNNQQVLNLIIERWIELGLLLKQENKLSLKIGAALTLFGGLNLFENKIQQVNQTIQKYQEDQKVLPMYALHGNNNSYPFLLNGFELYPTYSILGLKYPNGIEIPKNEIIISGINVATQFGIGHAVASKSISPDTKIQYAPLQLITDPNGQRLTRFNDSRPNLSSLYEAIELKAREKFNSKTPSSAINFSIIIGLLAHTSAKKSKKIDMRLFLNGISLFSKLNSLSIYLKRNNIKINSINYNNPKNIPSIIRNHIDENNYDLVIQMCQHMSKKISKGIHNDNLSDSAILEFMSTIWVLTGDWGISTFFEE